MRPKMMRRSINHLYLRLQKTCAHVGRCQRKRSNVYTDGKQKERVGRIDWKRYYDVYAPAFREAASVPPERKLASVFGLAGIRAPTGSTVAHFINPERMPIIDRRTVGVLVAARRAGVLLAAGRISTTKRRAVEQYEEFRAAISGISRDCPGWTLRQIDRALFAYHKQVLSGTRARRRLSFPAVCAT